jgi:hypothetical protein
MRIFRNKWFTRYARKEGITDAELRALVPLLEENKADANLGGDVYKMRVPRPGEGKSGGYRVFVYFRHGERTIFAHGLEKSVLSNISDKDERRLKNVARVLLAYTEREIVTAIANGELIEITEEYHEEISKRNSAFLS